MPVQSTGNSVDTSSEHLGEILVEEAVMAREQLDTALAQQAKTGEFIGKVLADLKFITEDKLTGSFVKYCQIPYLSLLDYVVDKLVELIPEDFCIKHGLLPIDSGKTSHDSHGRSFGDCIARRSAELCPELKIKPILCEWSHFKTLCERLFSPRSRDDQESEVTATSFGLGAQPVAQPAAQRPKRQRRPPLNLRKRQRRPPRRRPPRRRFERSKSPGLNQARYSARKAGRCCA